MSVHLWRSRSVAELLSLDTFLRYGYADDICLYRACDSLDANVRLLAGDVDGIIEYGTTNKIFFALEKIEMIHFTKKKEAITHYFA